MSNQTRHDRPKVGDHVTFDRPLGRGVRQQVVGVIVRKGSVTFDVLTDDGDIVQCYGDPAPHMHTATRGA